MVQKQGVGINNSHRLVSGADMVHALKKILPFLLNPFMLAVWPTVVIILLVPMKRDRYLLQIADRQLYGIHTHVFYEDITGDGLSEKIQLREREDNTSVAVFSHQGYAFNEWSFRGKFLGDVKQNTFFAGDYNENGQSEMFFFTISNDSLFLHGLFDVKAQDFDIRNRYVSLAGIREPHPDLRVSGVDMEDLNGDGRKELVFGISAGYSLFPRAVFAYYIEQDSLVVSPESFAPASAFSMFDITGNGKREVFYYGHASSNVSPDHATYHDHSNWLVVLDQDLQFLFEPVEIPGQFDSFRPFVFQEGKDRVILGIKNQHWGHMPAAYYCFSPEGFLLEKEELEGQVRAVFFAAKGSHPPLIAITRDHKDLDIYDHKMQPVKAIPGKAFTKVWYHDIDQNGHDEIIGYNGTNSELHVFRSGFRNPVTIELDIPDHFVNILTIKRKAEESQISFQVGSSHYFVSYGPNPMYYLNYGIYLLIYAGVLGFTFLTRNIQRRQLERQQETEKRISELQLNLIKNKLDPHFSINALNSVIQAIRDDRHEVAEDGLLQFVGMYRNMLLSADTIDRSLDEELAFTRSYLNLEQLRYDGVFDYNIEVAPGVDHATLVPKMIIQLHAENAVKHGLAPLGSGGMLYIGVSQSEGNLQIVVTDNGVGFAKGKEASGSKRSQGLAMMQEFYSLYHKINNRQVVSDIEELFEKSGKSTGTRVQISITQAG